MWDRVQLTPGRASPACGIFRRPTRITLADARERDPLHKGHGGSSRNIEARDRDTLGENREAFRRTDRHAR